MNKFNKNKNYNTTNNNLSEDLLTYSNEIGERSKSAKEKDEKRIKMERIFGAAAVSSTLLLGGGKVVELLPANTETQHSEEQETGIHSIDVSNFNTYESPIDGDEIQITFDEDGRFREAPNVPGNNMEPNLLHEVGPEPIKIDIDYEVSEQDSIPIARHEGLNTTWVGVPVELLPEDLQENLESDRDGVVWMSDEKASLYIDNSEEDTDPVEIR